MRGETLGPIWQSADVIDIGVEDADNPGVEIGVVHIYEFGGIQQHDVALLGVNVNHVLLPSNIVGRVVDPHELVTEHAVFVKDHVCPLALLHIFARAEAKPMKDAGQQVPLQLGDGALKRLRTR